MTPGEMRQLLVDELVATRQRHKGSREAMSRIDEGISFLRGLGDDDPQLVELAGLVEDVDGWNRILGTIPDKGAFIRWTEVRGHRANLDEFLTYARR